MTLNKRTILNTRICLIFFLIFFFSPNNIFAKDFKVIREATFTIDNISDLKVAETFTISNQAVGKYASKYQINFTNTPISDLVIVADEGKQALNWQESTQNNSKIITVDLPPVVGKDKSQQIILTYKILDAVIQQGQMTELTLPNLHTPEIDEININVETPSNLDSPAYTSAIPSSITNQNNLQIIKFANVKSNNSIRLLFGDHQTYQFALYYHLDYVPKKSGFYELTIPPDTNYQQVALTQLSQIPHSIYSDPDGNWIAKYPLENTNSPVVITGAVMVLPRPIFLHTPSPTSIKKNNYWQVNDQVNQLALNLKTPESIYTYVKNYLTYNPAKKGDNDNRLGSILALEQPSNANCMEFTDLFIAIANQANIPSRRVIGYANSNNLSLQPLSYEGDVLHSWPEYYWENQWHPTDPTWGNTTQGQDYFNSWDTQHVALAINRQFDDAPLPPLGAKDPQSRNIIFSTTGKFPVIEPLLKFTAVPDRYYLPFVKPSINIYVSNLSGIAKYNLSITDHLLDDIHLEQLGTQSQINILPFSKSFSSFKLNHRWWLPSQVIIESDGQIIKLPIPFIPRLFNVAISITIIFLYIGACVFTIRLAIKAWNLRIFGSKKHNSIHRKSNKPQKQS